MSEGSKIDWLSTDDIAELQGFAREHMRGGHIFASDAEIVRWQYRSLTHPDRISMLVARERGRIVGVLGLIDVAFCARGGKVTAGWLANWMVAPAARESQVGLSLLRHMLAEPRELIGVLGITEMALRIYRALGFTIRESIPRWVRVVSEDALSTLIAEPPSPYRVPPRMSSVSGQQRVSTWSEVHAQRWDELWEQRLAPRLIGTWRDAEYLRWRYLEHPRFVYRLRVAEDAEGSLRGLAVYRIVEARGAEGRAARIVELLGDEEAASALLVDVIAAAERADAAFAEFYCSAGAVSASLEACGFTLEREPTQALPALIEPLNVQLSAVVPAAFHTGPELSEYPALLDSDALYVTRSDSDQDRPQY